MKIHPTKLMGFYGVLMDISWALYKGFFAICLRPRKGLRIRGK